MKYILGAYSQLPYGSSKDDYEAQIVRQVKPLLTMVYQNPDIKLLLRLGMNHFEYYEANHPEINMLVADLCRKGQVELLTSSCYDTILPLVPAQERPAIIDKTTTFLRKSFGKKSSGLWLYNQIFNPSIISAMFLSDLEYVVISGFNQVQNSVLSTKPFYMDEMGKSAIIFPSDDRFSKEIADFSKDHDTVKFNTSIRKVIQSVSGAFNTIMINLDQLMPLVDCSAVFGTIYSSLGSNCTLPSEYISEHEIANSYYLPAGVYGRDFSLGKACSINQIILENPQMLMHYNEINRFRDQLKDCKRNTDDRKRLESLILKANSAYLYFPELASCRNVRYSMDKCLCEMESILSSLDMLPASFDINNDRIDEFFFNSKSMIACLDSKGARICRLNVLPAFYNLALHNGKGLFADSLRSVKTGKVTDLSTKRYEITPLDKKKQDFFAKCSTIDLEKAHLNITKRFKIRQNIIICDIGIENEGTVPLNDYYYESDINLCLPDDVGHAEVQPYETDKIKIDSKELPFNIKIFSNDKVNVSERPFTSKMNSWSGEHEIYQFTQYTLQRKFSINSMEEKHFTITLKIEKTTRRQQ